jgi:hypothetical protein
MPSGEMAQLNNEGFRVVAVAFRVFDRPAAGLWRGR